MTTPFRIHPRNQRVPALPRPRPLALCVSALILSGALAGPAGAQAFPPVINLGSLTGADGFRLDGVASDDYSGRSVSAAGDINGDGLNDLIIGAPSADPNGDIDAGSSHVVFGKSAAFAATLALSSLNGSNGFRLNGAAALDQSGVSVGAAGDINGDGLDDLIVGASRAGPNGNSDAGSSYVVFGKSTAFAAALALSSLNGSNGFRLDSAVAGDRSGYSVSAAGDINGDGLEDLMVGAFHPDPIGNSFTGGAYVVFGKTTAFAAALALSSLNGGNGFRLDGVAANDYTGFSVSAAGDINGDGLDDLIVGTASVAGKSYVVFGKSTAFAAALALSSLDGTNGFRINGVAAGDSAGRAVRAAGDINGDGLDDLIVGAYRADPNGNNSAGSSYVVFGKNTPFAATLALSGLSGTNGFRLDGAAANDFSGNSVSAAGDINGDGLDDLIVGAWGADPNGSTFAGSSYVLFGKAAPSTFAATLALSSLNGSDGFRLDGAAPGAYSGFSVSVAGDINGDGRDDLIIGAFGAEPNGVANAGSSYVLFGHSEVPLFANGFEG